jgi:hypothetical protein
MILHVLVILLFYRRILVTSLGGSVDDGLIGLTTGFDSTIIGTV